MKKITVLSFSKLALSLGFLLLSLSIFIFSIESSQANNRSGVTPFVVHESDSYSSYIVVQNNTLWELKESVNEQILQGYKPMGGVSVDVDNWYYQAMMR